MQNNEDRNTEQPRLSDEIYSPNVRYAGSDVYQPLVAEPYAQDANEGEGQRYVFNVSRFLSKCLKKIWVLGLLALLFALIGTLYANLSYRPKYTSSSTYVINVFRRVTVTNDDGETVVKVSSDLTTASNVFSNMSILIKSDRIISQAIASNPNITLDIDEVKSITSIKQISGTSIITITVVHESPQMAFDVANAMAKVVPVVLGELIENSELTPIEVPSSPPSTPNSKNDAASYALTGVIAAAILYFAVMFILDFTSSTIKDAKDAEISVGNRLLGVIPDNHKFRKRISPTQESGVLITDHSSGFSYIEAFKAMRIKFENLCVRHKYKSVLITSTNEHEGKTTIAINLAISLAKKKHKVLLVECDLRRPNLFYMMQLSDLEYGVLDVIDGVVPYKEAIRYVPEYGVYGLLSRRSVNDPTERIGSDAMRDLVLALEVDPSFDYIIYDVPPSLMMTDAEILTRYVDGAIMVIKEDTSQLHDIKNTIVRISGEKAVVLGTVLNAATRTEKRSIKRS